MATTVFREDFLGRDLVNPTTTSTDYLSRATGTSTGYMGIPLRRRLRVNSTSYTAGTEISFANGNKYTVSVAGTSSSGAPAAPAVGATVTDGGAVLLRTK